MLEAALKGFDCRDCCCSIGEASCDMLGMHARICMHLQPMCVQPSGI